MTGGRAPVSAAATVLLGLAVALGGCVSALRPVAESDLATIDPARADAVEAARLAAAAERQYARRPDLEAVRAAEALWLRAALADSTGSAAIIGLTETRIWLARRLEGTAARVAKATEAVTTAQLCSLRDADAPACSYWLALAVGVQAEQRRSTAVDGLRVMIGLLEEVIERHEELEYAGPRRVLALVLVRAPGWPSGPGDPDAGLVHARRAVELFGDYPPNRLALADALEAVEEPEAAGSEYRRALESAEAWRRRGHPDAEEWVQEALAAGVD